MAEFSAAEDLFLCCIQLDVLIVVILLISPCIKSVH